MVPCCQALSPLACARAPARAWSGLKIAVCSVGQPDYPVHAVVLPNDPYFGSQYPLSNTGQVSGTPGDDICAATACDWPTTAPR
jgi:hypothetical protein